MTVRSIEIHVDASCINIFLHFYNFRYVNVNENFLRKLQRWNKKKKKNVAFNILSNSFAMQAFVIENNLYNTCKNLTCAHSIVNRRKRFEKGKLSLFISLCLLTTLLLWLIYNTLLNASFVLEPFFLQHLSDLYLSFWISSYFYTSRERRKKLSDKS